MKEITIAEQPWLSIQRTIRITIDGIKYRLFRATVTVAVIVVAVAFLMNILAESLIKRAIAADTRERSANAQLNSNWSTRLTSPGSPESIIEELAHHAAGDDICQEARAFLKLGEQDFQSLQKKAVQAQKILDFFNDLDYAKRRDLIKTASGLRILDYLADQRHVQTFQQGLARYRMIRFDMTPDQLTEIISQRQELLSSVQRLIEARSLAVESINRYLKQTYPELSNDAERLATALTHADNGFGDVIRKAGFRFNAETVAPMVATQARNMQFTLRMKFSLTQSPKTLQALAQAANMIPSELNDTILWDHLGNASFAASYLEVMQKAGLDTQGLSPDLLVKLARGRQEAAALAQARLLTLDAGKGFMGLGERLAYLLCVSLLVCGIGITNAMMMSVTERFNEIATLKCLGALDGFIMIMFVLESCIMGILGGSIGALIGAVIGTGRMMAAFGVHFLSAIPFLDLLGGILISILLGTLLAAIAAVVPSFKAARLAPMEAMRVE